MQMMAMSSLLPVLRLERRRGDGDALAAHVVEDVDLVGERAAGKDLEDLQRLLERGPPGPLAHHPLDLVPLAPRSRAPSALSYSQRPARTPGLEGTDPVIWVT